jgi:cytochrome P450
MYRSGRRSPAGSLVGIRATIPTASGALPLLGHALPLFNNPLAFLRSLPGYGDLVRIRIGPASAIMICNPDLTRTILLDDRTFDRGGPLIDRVQEVFGDDGMSTARHNTHRRLRRLAAPAFHRERLPGYAKSMTAQIDTITGSWRDGQVIDVLPEMLTLTIKVTAGTLFSGTFHSASVSQAITDIGTLLASMYRRAITPALLNSLPTPANRRFHQTLARLRHTIETIITERRADGTAYDDLLSALLAARDHADKESKQSLTDAEVRDQVVTFFFAGAETTASLLSWTLHLLADHPEIERQLHAEVDTVLAGAPATPEHVPQLELTSRIIIEALRLYPPVWISTRTVTTDTILGAHPLPAGTTIAYSAYLLHRRSDLYEQPERFDPDRWIGTTPPPNAYIPFGGGARMCIGNQFGVLEATIALATITSRWRLTSVDHRPVHPTPAITLRPRALHARVTSRSVAHAGCGSR